MGRQQPLRPAAEALRLGQARENPGFQFDPRLGLDEFAAQEAERLRGSRHRAPARQALRRLAGDLHDSRGAPGRKAAGEAAGELAWAVLIALYCLPARGERLTIAALAQSIGVPQTTALGWHAVLTMHGLVERGPGDLDRELQMVRLTPDGRRLVESYLTRLFHA
jgi:hypothetical protein